MGIKTWFVERAIKNFIKKLEKENEIFKWLKGKKTYAILGTTIILGVIGQLNSSGTTNIQIPEIAFTILGALGWLTNTKRTSK